MQEAPVQSLGLEGPQLCDVEQMTELLCASISFSINGAISTWKRMPLEVQVCYYRIQWLWGLLVASSFRKSPSTPSSPCNDLELPEAWNSCFHRNPQLLISQSQKEKLSSKFAAAAKSLQSCLTLCDPIDGSPLGSPVPGILQAGTLEWVAISFSKENDF